MRAKDRTKWYILYISQITQVKSGRSLNSVHLENSVLCSSSQRHEATTGGTIHFPLIFTQPSLVASRNKKLCKSEWMLSWQIQIPSQSKMTWVSFRRILISRATAWAQIETTWTKYQFKLFFIEKHDSREIQTRCYLFLNQNWFWDNDSCKGRRRINVQCGLQADFSPLKNK